MKYKKRIEKRDKRIKDYEKMYDEYGPMSMKGYHKPGSLNTSK